jgi:hypothetical protein
MGSKNNQVYETLNHDNFSMIFGSIVIMLVKM